MRILLWVFALIFISCSTELNGTSTILRQVELSLKKDLSGYKAIFFVPSSGCSGCISEAESYLLNNYILSKRKGILFVVTGHRSEKSARVRLGFAMHHPDVLFDYTQNFNNSSFLRQYPKVLMIDDGKVSLEKEANPDESRAVYEMLNSI